MNLKANMSLLIFLIQMLLFTTGCKQTTEPKLEPELKLELEDVSCTEAWIKLTTTNLQLPATVTLFMNGTAQNNILCYGDTLLYVDSLLPKTTYSLQAFIQSSNQAFRSNEISITTMDTTSHNFIWQSWEFGEHSSSTLYDVAIIDENNIWAVGEIYMNDSLGRPDPNAYNAVHWDGTKWELKRIGGIGGWVCHTVFAFSANDIWFEGNIHWNGSTYTAHMNGWPLMPNGDGWRVNKMWGTSSEDLYAVGNNGNIAHWDGRVWRKIESGTTVDLLDVWGTPDGRIIWACGYTGDYGNTVLLRYEGRFVNKIYEGSPNNQDNNEYIGPISSVWNNSNYFTYVINWAFIYTQPNNNFLNINRITPWFSDVAFSMRGTNHNNIFITGQNGLVGHYNGVSYREIIELKDESKYLLKVDVKNNVAVTAGHNYMGILGSKAVVHIINKI